MDYSITMATPNDVAGIKNIMPRLADFNVPEFRNPDDLRRKLEVLHKRNEPR